MSAHGERSGRQGGHRECVGAHNIFERLRKIRQIEISGNSAMGVGYKSSWAKRF